MLAAFLKQGIFMSRHWLRGRVRSLPILVLLILCAPPAFSQSFGPGETAISLQINKIVSEADAGKKSTEELDLINRIRQNREAVTDNDIAVLSALLLDREDRPFAAGALGAVGPKARPAVPALEGALAREHQYINSPKTGVWLGTAICAALVKIGAGPMPDDCKYWL